MEIFRVTGPLCGEFTGPGEFPAQRPVTRSFDVFFDRRLNRRLSKQPWGWWFETPSWSLWRHRNVTTVHRRSVMVYKLNLQRPGVIYRPTNIVRLFLVTLSFIYKKYVDNDHKIIRRLLIMLRLFYVFFLQENKAFEAVSVSRTWRHYHLV